MINKENNEDVFRKVVLNCEEWANAKSVQK